MQFRTGAYWLIGVLTLCVAGAASCRWREPRVYEVKSSGDPNATYLTVQQALANQQYKVAERDDSARRVTVRAHTDEEDETNKSFITVNVTADGRVVLSPSGALVRPDGSVHRSLGSEVGELEAAIQELLGNPTLAVAPSGSAAQSSAPMAWNEAAYDPNTWGPGEFTCLPVKLPAEDQPLLKLKLSNGEEADVTLSLAYAPELCRSPAQCRVPGGCPALGLGDSQQVARLAERLVKREIQPTAVLLHRGQPVVTLDLTRHGLISKAMAQPKPSPAPAKSGADADSGW